MTRFLLIRHGATGAMDRMLCGRMPGIPLSAHGRRQAAALALRLTPVAAIFSSPVERATETAGIVGGVQRQTAEPSEAFTEFQFGEWTGKSFDDLHADPRWKLFNEHRDRASAPGGESMQDVQTRAISGLSAIASQFEGRAVAIVSHGDVIRSLLLWAAASAIRNYSRFVVDPASISELFFDLQTAPRLLRVNDCAHLENLPS